jgi:hypothetical protein
VLPSDGASFRELVSMPFAEIGLHTDVCTVQYALVSAMSILIAVVRYSYFSSEFLPSRMLLCELSVDHSNDEIPDKFFVLLAIHHVKIVLVLGKEIVECSS